MKLLKWFSVMVVFMIFVLSIGIYILVSERNFDSESKALFTEKHPLPPNDGQNTSSLRAKYFGTSTILFNDGAQSILIDGFFSRPSLSTILFRDFEPLPTSDIDAILSDAGISDLQTVAVVHSHHDHAMDSTCIANSQGAILAGSPSTMNISCKGEVVKEQFVVDFRDSTETSMTQVFGNYTLTFIKSKHSPTEGAAAELLGIGQPIHSLITPPLGIRAYAEGQSYSILIEHDKGNVLVHASAGFLPDVLLSELQDKRIDWLFLGVANIKEDYVNDYFAHTVAPARAKYIVPVHWDDFTRSSSETLYPARAIFGDFSLEIELLANWLQKSEQQGRINKTHLVLMNMGDEVSISASQ
ncbi:MBL fold metallo-hydrolase [Glaciecola petra]|uniref:MBL fold metallo-hydrolase n=1 Tax=Glaciecola petra TaxID=3075602 RepID=A0ABU2ZUF4_9ALTE|nr:hypothetical protein [Aestuariibacter sp. P117]MDT0595219.1 hypothetical protein [Aestuariibacter sp. P117]